MLIYSHAFAPSVGGVETYIMLLARGLLAPGRESPGGTAAGVNRVVAVTVITQSPAAGFDDALLPFRVIRQPGLRMLWRLLSEADVVHLAGPVLLPLALCLFRRKPVIVEHHGYQAVCPNGLLFYEPTKEACPGHFMARRYQRCLCCNAVMEGWPRSLLRILLTFPRRWLSKRAVVNIPVTQHVLRRLKLPRSQVIYHGIPDPLPQSEPPKVHPATISPPTCFAYIGRLVSEKGLPLLLQAAKRLKDRGYAFRLKFIGDGPERQRLETMTDALGLREQVFFTGFVQGDALRTAVADVACVVMPSVWEETAGLAAMEQMMQGRLVVATNIGGLAEVVGDAALKFPVGDVEGLVDRLRQVLEMPNVVAELGRRARERALALFRQGRMVEEHLAVYERLVNRNGLNTSGHKMHWRFRNRRLWSSPPGTRRDRL
jgi:glycogen(starch) synthase